MKPLAPNPVSPANAERIRRGVRALSGAWLVAAVLGTGCSMKSMIYPAPGVPVGAPPAAFEEQVLTLDDGIEIVVWHRPLAEQIERPVMLFFHGNGENLETMKWSGLYERLTALRVPVLVVDYPGYGRSTGQPSEESLKAAAQGALTWARQQHPERAVVPCGWSLGAALALHLAAEKPKDIQAAVAISPWVSLHEVARAHFPGWLVSMGLREEYNSLQTATRIEHRILVIHGTADSIIPIGQGELVAKTIPRAEWFPVEGAGHNDLLSFSVVWREIDRFVSGLSASSGL